ncbi:MAG TPA: hypothetical protein VJ873_11700 [bacterium]|nr:hypothetical protein [bacterium]
MEKEKDPVAPSSLDVPTPPDEPGPSCEREVAGYTDEFTLSGGCCGG